MVARSRSRLLLRLFHLALIFLNFSSKCFALFVFVCQHMIRKKVSNERISDCHQSGRAEYTMDYSFAFRLLSLLLWTRWCECECVCVHYFETI